MSRLMLKKKLDLGLFILDLITVRLQARDLSKKEIENLVRYSRAPVGIYEEQSFGFPFHYTAFGDWTNHGYKRADSGLYGEYFDIGW